MDREGALDAKGMVSVQSFSVSPLDESVSTRWRAAGAADELGGAKQFGYFIPPSLTSLPF